MMSVTDGIKNITGSLHNSQHTSSSLNNGICGSSPTATDINEFTTTGAVTFSSLRHNISSTTPSSQLGPLQGPPHSKQDIIAASHHNPQKSDNQPTPSDNNTTDTLAVPLQHILSSTNSNNSNMSNMPPFVPLILPGSFQSQECQREHFLPEGGTKRGFLPEGGTKRGLLEQGEGELRWCSEQVGGANTNTDGQEESDIDRVAAHAAVGSGGTDITRNGVVIPCILPNGRYIASANEFDPEDLGIEVESLKSSSEADSMDSQVENDMSPSSSSLSSEDVVEEVCMYCNCL